MVDADAEAAGGGLRMIRIVIDIEEYGTIEGTKECVAMALEHLGKVRIVCVEDGRSKK